MENYQEMNREDYNGAFALAAFFQGTKFKRFHFSLRGDNNPFIVVCLRRRV